MKTRHLILIISLAAIILTAVWGCNDQQTVTDPLVDIGTSRGATIQGTVWDTSGEPGTNTVLSLESMTAGLTESVARILASGLITAEKSNQVRTAVADSRGRFAFADLSAGSYLLTSVLRDHAGDSRTLKIQPQAVANVETTFVDIQLTPTGTFLGNATLENAIDHTGTVAFLEGTSYVAVTDAAGNFSLTGVPVGTWPTRAMHAGYLDDSTSGALVAAGDSVTLAPLFLRLNANLPPSISSFTATVANEGAATVFTLAATDPDGTVASVETDFEDDGVFDFSGPGTTTNVNHVYAIQGAYLAKLRVTDDDGAVALAVVPVTVAPPTPTAVFVSPLGDDANDGSVNNPVLTIGVGLVRAQSAALDTVKVAQGTYNEVVTLVDGISMRGGLNMVSWAPQAGVHSVISGDTRPVRANGITTGTMIRGFEIVAVNAMGSGEASVAVTLVDSDSSLAFVECLITAGNGGLGLAGAGGVSGASGNGGQSGLSGDCSSTFNNPGGLGGTGANAGGSGGRGGNETGSGSNGGNGFAGAGTLFGVGGSGGQTGAPGQNGFDGTPGGQGVAGNGGLVAGTSGIVSGDFWIASFGGSGSSGTAGSGGGGGGGGGGQEISFLVDGVGNSGGGGGAGGGSGQGGSGGMSGGASFGVLAINSSPIFSNCAIESQQGGAGSFGGIGGSGGSGGSGGLGAAACPADIGRGGNGAAGGNGGAGGGGAGGNGGPSYGIWRQGGTPTTPGSTFLVGTGGTGGPGGSPNGQSGVAGNTGTMN